MMEEHGRPEMCKASWAAQDEPLPTEEVKKYGRYDMEDESNFFKVDSASDDGLRHDGPSGRRYFDSPEDEYYPSAAGNAGDEFAHNEEICQLWTLPYELVDNILAYLSAIDLASISKTCRRLRSQAAADHLWHTLVQAHIPGSHVTTPYPCATFRDLYAAHDPCWFLPKYKIWFSDRDLTGKTILVRYDESRGCIEGHQLLAISEKESFKFWSVTEDEEVVIHCFEPVIKMHLDKPVLQLHTHDLDAPFQQETRRLGAPSSGSAALGSSSGSGSGSSCLRRLAPNRFAAERSMLIDGRPRDTMFSNLMLTQPLPATEVADRSRMPFPYGCLWPPPTVPAKHRVAAASRHCPASKSITRSDWPQARSQMSDQTFRIRTWLEMKPTMVRVQPPHLQGRNEQVSPSLDTSNEGTTESRELEMSVHDQATGTWLRATGSTDNDSDLGLPRSPTLGMHIGEEVTTYSTLDPRLYTPTADKPWRGIWVGDYSGHGCEFLLMNQPDEEDPAEVDAAEAALVRAPLESDEEFAARRRNTRVLRGRLEAIKLTGDPNVPRGEYTFVADDLGDKGFVGNIQDGPFEGVRAVRSKGHVAVTGFVNDKYIESQLLLVSHDRLAQYWLGFGHISFFERMNIDEHLAP